MCLCLGGDWRQRTRSLQVSDIKNARPDEFPLFSFDGLQTSGKILRNYDGDTANILVDYRGTPMHLKARLYGYDSPELHPPLSCPNRSQVIEKGNAAKKRLWELCTADTGVPQDEYHEVVMNVMCGNFDKYGRVLVTLFTNDALTFEFANSINHRMVAEGHGVPYYGGTKKSF
jgi:endonuclease YncB( thermonuclease family)